MIYFSESVRFKKHFKKLSKKEKDKFYEKMDLFIEDEYNPSLQNHKLHGKYSDYRSISIMGDLRVMYKQLSQYTYLLYEIGSHSQLYS